MGYDMYVVDREGNDVLVAPTDNADRSAWDEYFAKQRTTYTYLRRSIGSIGPLRDRLAELGMAFESVGRRMSYMGPAQETDPAPQGEDESDEDYQKRIDQFLRAQFDERPGIPLHKLCGNDGWWVTEHECKAALDIWAEAGSPPVSAYAAEEGFDDVIEFLRQGAAHGGFRVY